MNETPEQRRLAKKRSNEIDAQILKDKITLSQSKGPKLLLLGSGDSGKTTVLKQMKIIHGNGFSEKDRLEYRSRMMDNIVDSIRALVTACRKLNIPLGNPELEQQARLVLNDFDRGADGIVPAAIFHAVTALWKDKGIKACFARSNEFLIQDTADYFLNNIEKFMNPTYIPTDQDILYTRFRTTQVTETQFQIDSLLYSIYDVGGQQSCRVYWAPYFENNVNAIIFIASLAAYDQILEEDGQTNRMQDAVELFETVCNHPLLTSSNMILFLNKADLFEAKLKTSRIKKYFESYDESQPDANSFKSGCRYFKNMFLEQNKNQQKKIYTRAVKQVLKQST